MPAPGVRDIRRSVFGGLNMQSSLTNSAVPGITFSPTVGIAAGRIAKLGLSLHSFKDPLEKAVREVVIPSIQKNFEAGGRPEPWEDLAEYTIQRREDEGYPSGPPLTRSGRLKETMKDPGLWTITPTMAILADLPQTVWYGNLQQGGYDGSGGGAKVKVAGRKVRHVLEDIVDAALTGGSTGGTVPAIPPRPFVMLQPEDEDKITEIFIHWLSKQVMLAWPGVIL
jgi:phage gpG-like protein